VLGQIDVIKVFLMARLRFEAAMFKKITMFFSCSLLFFILGFYSAYYYSASAAISLTCLQTITDALAYKRVNDHNRELRMLLGGGDMQAFFADKYCGFFCPATEREYINRRIKTYEKLRGFHLNEVLSDQNIDEPMRSSFEFLMDEEHYYGELEKIFNKASKRSPDKRSAIRESESQTKNN